MMKCHELLALGFTEKEILVYKNSTDITTLPELVRFGRSYLEQVVRRDGDILTIGDPNGNSLNENVCIYDSYAVVFKDPEDILSQYYMVKGAEFGYTDSMMEMDRMNIEYFLHASVPGYYVYFKSPAEFMIAKLQIPKYNKVCLG